MEWLYKHVSEYGMTTLPVSYVGHMPTVCTIRADGVMQVV